LYVAPRAPFRERKKSNLLFESRVDLPPEDFKEYFETETQTRKTQHTRHNKQQKISHHTTTHSDMPP
jgi:hypothetical protein